MMPFRPSLSQEGSSSELSLYAGQNIIPNSTTITTGTTGTTDTLAKVHSQVQSAARAFSYVPSIPTTHVHHNSCGAGFLSVLYPISCQAKNHDFNKKMDKIKLQSILLNSYASFSESEYKVPPASSKKKNQARKQKYNQQNRKNHQRQIQQKQQQKQEDQLLWPHQTDKVGEVDVLQITEAHIQQRKEQLQQLEDLPRHQNFIKSPSTDASSSSIISNTAANLCHKDENNDSKKNNITNPFSQLFSFMTNANKQNNQDRPVTVTNQSTNKTSHKIGCDTMLDSNSIHSQHSVEALPQTHDRYNKSTEKNDPRPFLSVSSTPTSPLNATSNITTASSSSSSSSFPSPSSSSSYQQDILFTRIKELAKEHRWEDARALFRSAKKPNVVMATAVISACAQAKRWKEALEMLDEMNKRGIKPNKYSYSACISACEKGGQWEKALDLLQIMKVLQIQPDKVTYSACISACEKGNRSKEALALFNEMQQAGIVPDVISYTACISACGKGGDWLQAYALLKIMKSQGLRPNVYTYSACIKACESSPDAYSLAWDIFDDMKTQNLLPDLVCYHSILNVCAKQGRADQALQLVDQILALSLRPNVVTYNSAISCCIKQGNYQTALILLARMKNSDIQGSVITYTSCIWACERGRRLDLALDLLNEMIQLGLEPNLIAFNACISASARQGDPQTALHLLTQLKARKLIPTTLTYNTCLASCQKLGDVASALFLLQEMNSSQIARDLSSYNTILQVIIKKACSCSPEERASLVQNVRHLLVQMIQEKLPLQNPATQGALITFLTHLQRAEERLTFIHAIQKFGLRPPISMYNMCISSCAREGRAADIVILVKELRNAGNQLELEAKLEQPRQENVLDQPAHLKPNLPNDPQLKMATVKSVKRDELQSLVDSISKGMRKDAIDSAMSTNPKEISTTSQE